MKEVVRLVDYLRCLDSYMGVDLYDGLIKVHLDRL